MHKIVIVLCLLGLCTSQAFGQKKVKPIETEIDLYPLENSITLEFKNGDRTYEVKLYVFLSKKSGSSKKGKYLISTDPSLLSWVRALKSSSFTFESAKMSRKAKRLLLQSAKGNPSEQPLLIDLKKSETLRVFNVNKP